VKGLRTSANVMGTSHAVAIYQASQATYDLFDKSIVLYQGRQIYFGSARNAADYFDRMGWEKPARMTTGDFLTSVTNPTERRPKPGYESRVPRTPEEFEKFWLASEECKSSMRELEAQTAVDAQESALEHFHAHHNRAQSKHARPKSAYRISVAAQIRLCIRRAYQRMWNDKPTTMSKVISALHLIQ
jgi:ATP-binding cassette, subfamily G (WHITE), member 2, PDR